MGREPVPEQLEKRVTRYKNGTIDFNAAVEASRALYQDQQPIADLEILQDVLRHYRFLFKENPVGGGNAEITEHFLGLNEKSVVFLDASHVKLSGKNELLDRWGGAFFFHQMSATEMNISSPGPDGELWTDDDVLLEH